MSDAIDLPEPGEALVVSPAVTGAGVQSVDRALGILEVLARTGESGVTELAVELGVHKSTAFRLVATLEAHRLVEQTSDRGRYRLGMGILRLAGATTIRNAHGDVVASMSVSGPSFRLPEDRLTEVVRLVVSAAEEVSHRLGWGHR